MRTAALLSAALTLALACGAPPSQSGAPPAHGVDGAEGEGEGEGEGAFGEGEGEGAVGEGEGGEGEGEGEGDGVCPTGVICVDALPYTADGNTVDGGHALDSYSCAPTKDESGPEIVYRVALPGAGTLAVSLDTALEAGDVDVDVHILSSLDATACLARGDQHASASVDGAYAFVVLDSYEGDAAAGSYVVSFAFVPAGALGDDDEIAAVLTNAGVPADVAALAAHAYNAGKAQDLTDSSVFTVVDFALPSSEKRLWIVDLLTGALLVHERVAHGIGSQDPNDLTMASTFSNTPGSEQSSLGLVRTAEVYDGNHPHSLRLDGLEDSNSNMRDRLVVMHGADYAEDSFVDDNGYLGRSNGCFAVAQSREEGIVDIVKEGTLLWAYFPDADWLASSPFLQ